MTKLELRLFHCTLLLQRHTKQFQNLFVVDVYKFLQLLKNEFKPKYSKSCDF